MEEEAVEVLALPVLGLAGGAECSLYVHYNLKGEEHPAGTNAESVWQSTDFDKCSLCM